MDQMTLFDAPPFIDRLHEATRGNRVVNVPVSELADAAIFGDLEPDETVDDLREYKIKDCGSAFIESIKAEGVVSPIEVSTGRRYRVHGQVYVSNGHHRLFIAEHLGIDTVPVQIDPYCDWDDYLDHPRPDLPWSAEEPWQRERLPLTPLHFG